MIQYDRKAPFEVQPGDSIAVAHDRMNRPLKFKIVKNVLANPRGCKGKTHIDGACYDNVATVDVQRV